jgi:hypothetical protein
LDAIFSNFSPREKLPWIAVLAALIAPYFFDVCWKFLPSIGLVVIFTRLASRRYLSLLGIEFKRRELPYAAFAFLGTWLAAYLLTPYLLGKASLQVRYVNLGWALMPISQAALEELVLHGLLLSGLSALMPKNIRQVAIVSALLFMLWHLFFFPFTEGVWLSSMTLATLYLFGYASSLLFLVTRTIAIPLALHAGWNLVKFNGMLVDTNTLGSATQAASFNAVEGSSVVFVLAVTLVAFVEFFFISCAKVIFGNRA